jgi:hypothetical protein
MLFADFNEFIGRGVFTIAIIIGIFSMAAKKYGNTAFGGEVKGMAQKKALGLLSRLLK